MGSELAFFFPESEEDALRAFAKQTNGLSDLVYQRIFVKNKELRDDICPLCGEDLPTLRRYRQSRLQLRVHAALLRTGRKRQAGGVLTGCAGPDEKSGPATSISNFVVSEITTKLKDIREGGKPNDLR